MNEWDKLCVFVCVRACVCVRSKEGSCEKERRGVHMKEKARYWPTWCRNWGGGGVSVGTEVRSPLAGLQSVTSNRAHWSPLCRALREGIYNPPPFSSLSPNTNTWEVLALAAMSPLLIHSNFQKKNCVLLHLGGVPTGWRDVSSEHRN